MALPKEKLLGPGVLGGVEILNPTPIGAGVGFTLPLVAAAEEVVEEENLPRLATPPIPSFLRFSFSPSLFIAFHTNSSALLIPPSSRGRFMGVARLKDGREWPGRPVKRARRVRPIREAAPSKSPRRFRLIVCLLLDVAAAALFEAPPPPAAVVEADAIPNDLPCCFILPYRFDKGVIDGNNP